MKIEEAIQQDNWASEQQKLEVNIIYTYFWIKEQISNALKPYGITMQQYNVMRILRGQHPGGITTSDIRSRMLDKMSDASRLVERLAKVDLVEKKVNKEDRRLVCVKITEDGLSLLEKIEADGFLRKDGNPVLNDDDAKCANLALDKLREEL